MTEITNNHFVIEVPIEGKDFRIELDTDDTYHIDCKVSADIEWDWIFLPEKHPTNYAILGYVTESEIDFDVSGCIKQPLSQNEDWEQCNIHDVFWDHLKQQWDLDFSPHDSFRSLLKSKGIEIKQGTKLLVVKKIIEKP